MRCDRPFFGRFEIFQGQIPEFSWSLAEVTAPNAEIAGPERLRLFYALSLRVLIFVRVERCRSRSPYVRFLQMERPRPAW